MTGAVLVSGGRGFIGRRLVARLRQDGADVHVMTRGLPGPSEIQAELTRPDTLPPACSGVDTVYHCAGHAHAFACLAADEEARHWQVNFEGTRALAEAAGQAGVRCFVFLSSVKAQAEPGELCADEDAPGVPDSAYGQAKRAAEEAVLEAGRRHGMRVINLRPAMVFGAGGRGNLERMAALVRRGLFPPLPETGNRRSMVHVDDLVAAMRLVAGDPRAAGRTYIIAHAQAPSGRGL
jgi:nucleoside-diphosphate-sugar epimerase